MTTSISSKTPCLTIVHLVPPKYSPGHPINITEPPILSITLPNASVAATDIAETRLCPVIWPSSFIASYSQR